MITHVVLFRWQGDADRASRALQEHLPAMMAEIGGVESFECGPDLGRLGSEYDCALIVHLPDEEALARYEAHPAHQQVIAAVVNPGLGETGSVATVQFGAPVSAGSGR